MAKGRKGKYHEWLTPDGLLLIEGWAREGLTEEQIAKNMGCAYDTLNEWKKKFSDISEALKRGKAPVDIQVENALLKRALGYEYEEVTTEVIEQPNGKKKKQVKKTTKVMPPDTTAQIYWLKNRRPDRWRDTRNIETKSSGKLAELIEGLMTTTEDNEDDLHEKAAPVNADVAEESAEENKSS